MINPMGRKSISRLVCIVACVFVLGPTSVWAQVNSLQGLDGLSSAQIEVLSKKMSGPGGPVAMPSGIGGGSQVINHASADRGGGEAEAHMQHMPRVVAPGVGIIISLDYKKSLLAETSKKSGPYKKIYTVPNNRGQINLHEFGRFDVMGYSAEEIAERLSVDVRLTGYDVSVLLLPVDVVSVDRLRPFGSEVFGQGNISSRTVSDNLAPPSGYIYGPGDSFIVQYYGKTNSVYELTVLRDGLVNLPELGPIRVAGMTFASIRDEISRKVSEELIGVSASVSVGALRSIGVLALGEFASPGPVSVPAGASLIDVIIAAGGLRDTASYRRVSIRRDDTLLSTVDLYDLLASTGRSLNTQLRQEDIVTVHPAGPRVSVLGEVRRPALYELDGDMSAESVVRLAGGLSDNTAGDYSVERLNERGEIDLITGNLSVDGKRLELQRGDVIRVDRALSRRDNAVILSGHFENPGYKEWRKGMTLLEVLPSVREFMPKADLNYLLILRETGPSREVNVLSVSYESIISGVAKNVTLSARDEIVSLPLGELRAAALERLLLRVNDSRKYRKQETVEITGAVRFPGIYFYEKQDSVDSLIEKAGGLLESAFLESAELVRYSINDELGRENIKTNISLTDTADLASLKLVPDDTINIFTVPNWSEPRFVEVSGEVRFPGRYTITRGERLSDLLVRVGGITEEGYLAGALFQRERLREREREELARLRERLSNDLRAMAVQMDTPASEQEGLLTARRLLQESEGMEPLGRLVVDFDRIAEGGVDDILLRHGDTLVVPPKLQTVSVIGEVNMIVSHRWRADRSASDYLDLSGGLTRRADDKQVYVVRASGEVRSLKSGWFSSPPEIMPGDTIVVPLNTSAIRPMQLARDITQILSQVALTVAAFSAVGVF